VRIRDALGITERRQRQLTYAMEIWLIGLVFIGLYELNVGIFVNSVIGLAVTQLVPVLERDYGIPMDPALTLWITSAVFLHALGTVGLPGSQYSFYQSVWWWDHLTHTLSASIVAAAGYATARAVDQHSQSVRLPPRFMFVFILLFVIAFGVLWEVLEFTVAALASALGAQAPLTQYGLEDTMSDLLFDVFGAIIVALWGTAHLTDVVGALSDRLQKEPSQ
jgi:uncharacterized membrane protein YjdF